jgi:hypothetical protein
MRLCWDWEEGRGQRGEEYGETKGMREVGDRKEMRDRDRGR